MSHLLGNRSVPVPSLQTESELSVQHPCFNSQYGQPILPRTHDEVPASEPSMLPSRVHMESEIKGSESRDTGLAEELLHKLLHTSPKHRLARSQY